MHFFLKNCFYVKNYFRNTFKLKIKYSKQTFAFLVFRKKLEDFEALLMEDFEALFILLAII